MILRKGEKIIKICDRCLERKELVGGFLDPESRIDLKICNDCLKNIPEVQQINPIKRLKWYEVLYQYKEKGYELEDD